MLKRISFLVTFAALGATVVCAQSNLNFPVARTSADSGKQMFVNYCAPCHGVDGKGNGPMVASLKTMPTNLTELSKDHQGVFPADHVAATLRFGVESPSHGSKAMPVWGPALNEMDHSGSGSNLQALRISNIVHYVETLQAK